jgi:signal transduction histidine kinase
METRFADNPAARVADTPISIRVQGNTPMRVKRPTLELEPLAHGLPTSPRFWIYAATAYLLPVVVQIAFPEDPALTDELVWLVTLAPAFLLSLQYGLKGAFAALILGTTLFLVVQVVVAMNFTPDDWRITMPIYIAYGVITISVGWLAEKLHSYYQVALKNERMAAIGQLAVTVNHRVNNSLAAIVADSDLLLSESDSFEQAHKESLERINDSAMRIARDVRKIAKLRDAPVVTYGEDVSMVDLDNATEHKVEMIALGDESD